VKRHRVILQLESELAQAEAASADNAVPELFDNPQFVDGYWHGRVIGLVGALAYLKERTTE
jgi:hypothetical protein